MHFYLILKVLYWVLTSDKWQLLTTEHPPEDAVDDEVDAAVDGDEQVVALSQSGHLQAEVLKCSKWN